MSDKKHARGPWTMLLHSYRGGADDSPYGLTDADATIADAAPDLLAALGTLEANGFLGCVTEPPCGACTCCDARAAIAKAREDQ